MANKRQMPAALLLVLAAICWSTSGVLIKSIDWSPVALASARGLLASVTLALILPGGFKPSSLTKWHWLAGAGVAVLSMTFVAAMSMTSAANAVVLQYTAPLWVAILAPIVLRERTSGRDWFFTGLMFLGIVLFFFDNLSLQGFWGNILAMCGGLLFGLQAMALRKLKSASPGQALILGNFLTFLVGLPAWGTSWPSPTGWLCVIALGVVQMGVAYYFYAQAIPRVTSLELVLVPILEPIICPIWVAIFLDEIPGFWAICGSVSVIASVTVWSWLKARSQSGADAR